VTDILTDLRAVGKKKKGKGEEDRYKKTKGSGDKCHAKKLKKQTEL
jgi:hypothetical protein